MARKQFSPDFLAALHSGAVDPSLATDIVADADAPADGGVAPGAPPANAPTPTPATPATPSPTPAAAVVAAPALEATAGPAAGEGAAERNDLVAHLRNELKEIRLENDALKFSGAKATDRVAALEAEQPKLLDIVRKASEVMAIAIGSVAVGLDAMSVDALVEYHGNLRTAMQKKYPVGQRSLSAVTEVDTKTAAANATHPVHMAAVGSTQL